MYKLSLVDRRKQYLAVLGGTFRL